MSRFYEWTRTELGIINWLSKYGLEIDFRGKGRPNMYAGVEVRKIIFQYAKAKKMKGSYTSLVLQTGENFDDFKSFIKSNEWPRYQQPKT